MEPMCSTLLTEDSGPFYVAGLLRLIILKRVFGFLKQTKINKMPCSEDN